MNQRFAEYADRINEKLDELSREPDAPKLIVDALRYSLLSGGKRLRGSLTLAANAMLGGDADEAIVPACAIEMIHCFSLIHDDLPAMDDDDIRRGKPSNHVVFGEGIALLAGDALLALAFEKMTAHALGYPDNLKAHMIAIERIARASGVRGMAGGQCLDLQGIDPSGQSYQSYQYREERLLKLHTLKTAALISASVAAGLILANASGAQIAAGEHYGTALGIAFQIRDDILDVEGDPSTLGKRVGMDAGKETWVSANGLEGSKRACDGYLRDAAAALEPFGDNAGELLYLLDAQRERKA
ncbi:MAG: polyprenyl synthetase family protein [Oscillospiraceae bacterium]|jgi:geranylgeranyl diphosphate synthase type II|nr:polyprenyl synthetase family protein [Oscillospiraceae bacterium]